MNKYNIVVMGEDKTQASARICKLLEVTKLRVLSPSSNGVKTLRNIITYFYCLRAPTYNSHIIFNGCHLEFYNDTDELTLAWLRRKDKDLLEDWERGFIQRETVVVYAGDDMEEFNRYRAMTQLATFTYSHFERKLQSWK